MSSRFMTDVAPDSTCVHVESGSDTTITDINDRNPANPQLIQGTDYRIAINLGNNTTPVNSIALFGVSDNLDGAQVDIRYYTADAYGDFASFDYTGYITGSRFWVPMGINYDATNDNYYQYVLVKITPSTVITSEYIGELSAGLLEEPIYNYIWGRSESDDSRVIINTTIGGIDWVHRLNKVMRRVISLSWSGGAMDEQQMEQLRYWYSKTENGLYPFVFIPEAQYMTDECYYVRFPANLDISQQFFDQYNSSIELREVIHHEE